MKRLLLTLVVLAAASLSVADEPLPLIVEEVDEICVIQTPDSDYCRVVFFRGDSVLATRLVVDEMTWTADNGYFRVIWQDYWTADRVVDTKNLSVWYLDEDPTQQGQNGPWWCMFRNMRDLKQ